MTIWVDADSCPGRVREIISRAAARTGCPAKFVANRKIPLDQGNDRLAMIVVGKETTADAFIVENAGPGDLVVTRDIPLAAELVAQGYRVLNDRGIVYTTENIRERLSLRNFMQELRDQGLASEKASAFGRKEIQAFSQAFDRELRHALGPG